jgi:hypothetical protein
MGQRRGPSGVNPVDTNFRGPTGDLREKIIYCIGDEFGIHGAGVCPNPCNSAGGSRKTGDLDYGQHYPRAHGTGSFM